MVEGLNKTELLERLSWVKQVVEVMQVMRDWPQVDRVRTIGTILACMVADSNTDEEQAERVLLTVATITPRMKAGITERMMDEEYMSQSIRAELAKLSTGSSN